MQSAALPTFCAYLASRFGAGWVLSPKGPLTAEAFRAAKRDYEALLGARVYSARYAALFHPRFTGGEELVVLPRARGIEAGS